MAKKDLSLYIHIPFCAKKCNYCDFLSCPAAEEEISYYLRNLIKEIRSFEPVNNLYTVKTIFVGGGTPSILTEEQIEELTNAIYETYDVADDVEFTIECNPGSATEKKLNTYIRLGINRLSIGLQSADNDELKLLGRIHTFEDFEKTYFLARKAGFENINIDIMSGIPNQTMESYLGTLSKVISLKPEHISSYSLQLEEGTPFYERYTNPLYASELPSEKLDRDMYKYTMTFLAKAGYDRYEISNYSLSGKESKHNTVYWELKDYLGFGLGASSYFDGKRFSNPKDFEEYKTHAISAYEKLSTYEPQSVEAQMEEFMFLGLRLRKGISIYKFEETFGKSFEEVYGTITKTLYEKGFLEFNNDNMCLSDKGIDVSNIVLSNFLLG